MKTLEREGSDEGWIGRPFYSRERRSAIIKADHRKIFCVL